MNFSNLLKEVTGAVQGNSGARESSKASGGKSSFASGLPGGLAGGVVAGGLVGLLAGNKSARKTAGTAAKYGGAAVLGGLAYKAYKNWQHSQHEYSRQDVTPSPPPHSSSRYQSEYEQEALAHMNNHVNIEEEFQLKLIKAMIASARADGQIDGDEQRRISEAINRLTISVEKKSKLLTMFLEPVAIAEFTANVESLEQKAEIYLASCLAIDLDDHAEYSHLTLLARTMGLPVGLEHELRAQAKSANSEAVSAHTA